MSVPFSNTHLRVPRGFGSILEGLTREVLRDQPNDIPTYAALYFGALLKQREESGVDPAEWAAKLEDRFYNNHAFKNSETSPDLETTSEMNISKEKSFEPQTEDESSHSVETSTLSTTQPGVSELAASAEGTDEDEENDISEKFIVSTETGLSERESVADIQTNEASGDEEGNDPAITTPDHTDRPDKETVSNPIPDQSIARSDSQPAGLLSDEGTADVDVCAQELGVAEDGGGGHPGSMSVSDSEKETTEVAEPVEMVSLSGPADVNVCAAELGGTERAMEGETVQDDSHVGEEEESWKPQVEETVTESLLPQSEITEGSQAEASDQAQKTTVKEMIETGVSCGETNESIAHIEGDLVDNITPEEDSLVEISFEDVPEAQRITPVGEQQPEEETSIDVVQTNILEMQQMEASKELTASSPDQNLPHIGDSLEPQMEIVKEECNSEEEEKIESQHAAFDLMTVTEDTNNSNLNDSDVGEEEKGVKSISSSDQPTTEAEREIQEDETSSKSVDIDEIHKDEFDQNQESQADDPGFTDETPGTGGGDEEDICTEGCSKMGEQEIIDDKMERDPSEQTQPDTSAAGAEGGSQTFEESAQQLQQENEESQRSLLESPEDSGEEKEVTPQEAEEHTHETADCEIQEETKAVENEETISLTHSADWVAADHPEEERPAKSEDSTELTSKSDEEECSRPQEEEDIMDIPLDDPEANRAAAKIQAGFRGHMTRKKMKPEDKSEGEEVSSTGDVLNGSQGVSETGRSGAVERDDTSVPEQ